ncbi:MAG: cytochrome c biogenesis protein CcdA [Oscillospiraceae bacterium]|nr:cytochrome c biogenesis protein CcdA [Oscillospiraceae bacterium]
MRYLITFLEGIMSFISPCMLPMLPIYVFYFAGESREKARVLLRACAFVLGFTLVFCAMGVFAGSVGGLLTRHQRLVNGITGGIVILFGLQYLELIRLPLFSGMKNDHAAESTFSAFVFGLVFSVSLTPCVGAFLGSALMLAANASTAGAGLLLLLIYSLGLGLPFVLAAVLIDQLQGAFRFIKAYYRAVNVICGAFLIVVGLFMAFGYLNKLLGLFS